MALLESLYNSNKFEMLILHGRRRVGKSYLLSHFAKLHSDNNKNIFLILCGSEVSIIEEIIDDSMF